MHCNQSRMHSCMHCAFGSGSTGGSCSARRMQCFLLHTVHVLQGIHPLHKLTGQKHLQYESSVAVEYFADNSCSAYLHRSSCCIHGVHGVESMCAMHCAWLAGLILTHATAGRWPCCHHAHTILYQLGILLPVPGEACMSARLSALVEPAAAAATAADAYDHA